MLCANTQILFFPLPRVANGGYLHQCGRGWQSNGDRAPDGEAKPYWKVLRALATYSQCEGVEYKTAAAIMDELMAVPREPASFMTVLSTLSSPPSLMRYAPRPLYSVDPLVRRSEPLQKTALAGVSAVQLHPDTAAKHGVDAAAEVTVQQGGAARTFPLQ